MNKSELLKTNIYNLAKSKVWSVDYAEYQAISWNEKGILTEADFNELIEKLEALRVEEVEIENAVQDIVDNNVVEEANEEVNE